MSEERTVRISEDLCRRLEEVYGTTGHPDAESIVRILVEEVLSRADDRLQAQEEAMLVERLRELGYV